MSFDDFAADRQAKAGSALSTCVRFLCCKEWVEDLLQLVIRDSAARITHRNFCPTVLRVVANDKA